jgi:Prolipoprotein diacylglyceryl transferase
MNLLDLEEPMTDITFLLLMTATLSLLLAWGFANLPRERWQMLAVIPFRKTEGGRQWSGINLTYYGFFLATSQLLAVMLLLILLGAARLPLAAILLVTVFILAVCIPAARIVAILVEKKRHGFTIGGASFVGILLAPWCILLVERIMNEFGGCDLPMLPIMAAMAIAYTLGEGLGRLGCISFGCCYGKAIEDCHPLIRKLFSKTAFIFQGETKKAIYEGKLHGRPLVPIQAVTCILYCLTAIAGSFLFLRNHATAALILSIAVTQVWRIFSETLRADFRGFSKISAYQKMGAAAVVYVVAVALFFHVGQIAQPNVASGIHLLWQPGIIIGLQIFWLIAFLVFGRSTITTSTLSFDLVREHL